MIGHSVVLRWIYSLQLHILGTDQRMVAVHVWTAHEQCFTCNREPNIPTNSSLWCLKDQHNIQTQLLCMIFETTRFPNSGCISSLVRWAFTNFPKTRIGKKSRKNRIVVLLLSTECDPVILLIKMYYLRMNEQRYRWPNLSPHECIGNDIIRCQWWCILSFHIIRYSPNHVVVVRNSIQAKL